MIGLINDMDLAVVGTMEDDTSTLFVNEGNPGGTLHIALSEEFRNDAQMYQIVFGEGNN
jgi:hypothetical protein